MVLCVCVCVLTCARPLQSLSYSSWCSSIVIVVNAIDDAYSTVTMVNLRAHPFISHLKLNRNFTHFLLTHSCLCVTYIIIRHAKREQQNERKQIQTHFHVTIVLHENKIPNESN